MSFSYTVATFILSVSLIAAPVLQFREVDSSQLLNSMTPEEKVGQLFLISAPVNRLEPDGYMYDLVRNYHIGGIVLEPPETNETPYTPQDLLEIINDLQQFRYDVTGEQTIYVEADDRMVAPEYVPLFMSAKLTDEQLPMTRVVDNGGAVPSQLALGASWEPEYAYETGIVVGRQLSALGINMVFSPALDVLDDPGTSQQNGIGVRSFGGDPYWVGVMGEEYISGLHDGSDWRVNVVSTHFPGLGSSDRPMEEEIATIRKSLEQLKQIELAPFFSVTDGPIEDSSVTDGLLTGHIRYQGFQGNIRATTKPVSLDSTALSQILALEPFEQWLQSGGLVISDSLGYQSIKRFIESTGRGYTGYLVARDAFLAGNDMMILSDMKISEEKSEYDALAEVMTFFVQKYREDEVFAQQVDTSVLKILEAKSRLYGGEFDPDIVLVEASMLDSIDPQAEVSVNTARSSLTLISPSDPIELEERTGGAPAFGDQVVIFSDTRQYASCISCTSQESIPLRAFEDAVNRLYGPAGAGLVNGRQFSSYSMEDLAVYLGLPITANTIQQVAPVEEVDTALREADWIIFLTQDFSERHYGADALLEFLNERSDLLRDSLVVVYSVGAPFGLDATDFSKVDVYFGLYSSSAPFIEAAARVLFTEMTPSGASPVSVPGVGYELIKATSPDPEQIIPLEVIVDGETYTEGDTLDLLPGTMVELSAGPILDTNGHIVPDKTPVDFVITYQGDPIGQILLTSTTTGGKASSSFTIDRPGTITAAVESSGALFSQQITMNVPAPEAQSETPVAEEPADAVIAPPTDPVEVTAVPAGPEPVDPGRELGLGTAAFGYGMLGLLVSAGSFLLLAAVFSIGRGEMIRYLLLVIGSGLLCYNFLALGLPGSAMVVRNLGTSSGFAAAASGGVAADLIILYRLWAAQLKNRRQQGKYKEESYSTDQDEI